MRSMFAALFSLGLAACAPSAPPSAPVPVSGDDCYINVSYVRDNELSHRVWEYIVTQQADLLDSGDQQFAASLWYDRGHGRAGFIYRLDCDVARQRVEAALERFAERAPTADVARALRDAKTSIREVTEAEFSDTGPL